MPQGRQLDSPPHPLKMAPILPPTQQCQGLNQPGWVFTCHPTAQSAAMFVHSCGENTDPEIHQTLQLMFSPSPACSRCADTCLPCSLCRPRSPGCRSGQSFRLTGESLEQTSGVMGVVNGKSSGRKAGDVWVPVLTICCHRTCSGGHLQGRCQSAGCTWSWGSCP